MAYRLTPVVRKIVNILSKYGIEIKRWNGDHIILNRNPPLKRPIVLVNEKRLSNKVRQNLVKECEEIGIKKEEFMGIFKEIF